MADYNLLTPQLVEQLYQILGERNVIVDDVEKLEVYASDEISDKRYAHRPEAVVKPRTTAEVSAVMRLANEHRIPVTPRGAGTGIAGGAVPMYGGIVLSLERMNRILEVDVENMVVVVEPGVVTNEINVAAGEFGLFYAGYPMSLLSCFIGGNVATNAGGGKAVKYGVTNRYVLGLEVVLPSGEIVELGGKRFKDVVGYNLVQLMVGSEGTLGVFTKIILKLIPLPKVTVDLLALFNSFDEAIAAIPGVMTHSGTLPTAIEFMSPFAVQASAKYLNEELPLLDKAGGVLLIEVDGSSGEELAAVYEAIGEGCEKGGAFEVYVAPNATRQERLWALRRNVAEALMTVSPVQTSEDVVVPISRIPDLMKALNEVGSRYDVLFPAYGHAGDGNVHVRIIKKPEMPLERWDEIKHALLEELFKAVAALGGTISGEHGIGMKKKEFVTLVLDENVLALSRGIRDVFDPNHIMNPGKVFPDKGV
ncbi:MAG: FAD-linked oxidase C-terminal domain-containing protein [Anaerolineae bacterium]|jgi:glycolate oxidase|nr:FAD-linked oxidase C-terminal domain-containing protein [Anaerolineae bacterium]